jgi:hypothetical protein
VNHAHVVLFVELFVELFVVDRDRLHRHPARRAL